VGRRHGQGGLPPRPGAVRRLQPRRQTPRHGCHAPAPPGAR
jgi:hypothetical protein